MKLREVVLKELRDKIREIDAKYEGLKQTDDFKNEIRHVAEIANLLIHLSKVSKKEGILAVEYVFDESYEGKDKEVFREMIAQIIDGVDISDVEDIFMTAYFVKDLRNFDGFCYLMFLSGILIILLENNNHYVFERAVELIIPSDAKDVYNELKEIRVKKEEEAYFKEGEKAKEEALNALNICEVKNELYDMNDKEIQRVLREANTQTIVIAMWGWNTDARVRILNNMSTRYSHIVVKDMLSVKNEITPYNVVIENNEISKIIYSLRRQGEI